MSLKLSPHPPRTFPYPLVLAGLKPNLSHMPPREKRLAVLFGSRQHEGQEIPSRRRTPALCTNPADLSFTLLTFLQYPIDKRFI